MSFVRRYLWSTDHKVIAKQYLWAGLIFLLLGGLLALVIRWQWAYPGSAIPGVGSLLYPDAGGVVTPADYTSLFTNHGLIMIFFAITPILIGALGNFSIPLLIGARDMAFPRLNATSFWTLALSQVLVLASLIAKGSASAGWTLYAPLSTGIGAPGLGQTLMIVAIFVTGASSVMGAVNFITTVLVFRAPGMTWMRLPLAVWGQFLTAILTALFVPVLTAAGLLLLLDRVVGTQFFQAGALGGQGDPVLYQHLFWIFGHPEVYILILPVWGILGDVLAVFSRKPAYWYRGTVFAMITVTVLSGMVYGHHMYQSGFGPLVGSAFEALTLAITAPAVVLFINWLMTLWGGAIRLTVPMLFAVGTMVVFALGGLTGIYLGAITTDTVLHDTLFVVGHFHLIMAAATFFGSLTAIYYWYPKLFGRQLSRRLGQIHFWGTLVFALATFGTMMLAGYAGQHRRLYDPYQYEYIAHLHTLNKVTSHSAFTLGAFQLVFAYNFIVSLWRGAKAEDNPWQATTLEWTTSSPPPEDNFEEVPEVRRGPHELGNPEVLAATGRDFATQSEVLMDDGDAARAKTAGEEDDG